MAKKYWKKYQNILKEFDKNNVYNPQEASELVKKNSYSKFVWTVEAHIKTWANPKYNDQMIRGTVVLPHGTGKTKRVAVFTTEDNFDLAKEAWADLVSYTDLLEDIEKWNIDFDVLVTTQDMMKDLAKVAKILWPRWVMPSPKAWTVTNNIKETVSEVKKWRVEFKLDKTGNIHVAVWKTDFDALKIKENLDALISALLEAKPSWVKWNLIEKVTISPTMWPGVQVKY